MGLDVYAGIMYGVNLYDGYIKDKGNVVTLVTRYDRITGEPYKEREFEPDIVAQKDFWDYKEGQRVDVSKIQERIRKLSFEFHQIFADSDIIVGDYGMVGITLGNFLYASGDQCESWSFPPDMEKIVSWWNNKFPNMEAKVMVFTHFNY